ncbi:MAG TPA: T9SS sorting signal type C domain-containing protein [Flavobacterium sp.]|nr:T9SS sorting signal type C domain-containing protein [Flavobacterium sp.]
MKRTYSYALSHLLCGIKNYGRNIRTSKIVYLGIVAFALTISSNLQAQCPTPDGDQVTYGTNNWTGYVYFPTSNTENPPSSPFSANYAGYLTTTPNFVQDYGENAIAGPHICGSSADNVAIRYLMTKDYSDGNYTFTVGGNDGYRLSVDGGATYLISNWTDHVYETSTETVYLSGTVYLVLEYYENDGAAKVSFSDDSCTEISTAPTSITGVATICSGASTTLTAAGGDEAAGVTYEWGYGTTAGYDVIDDETGPSITISATETKTIWVRRIDAGACGNTTAAAFVTVTVQTPSTAPTVITGSANICIGESIILTADGSPTTGSEYEWGNGSTAGDNVFEGQTDTTLTVTPSVDTIYWVRIINESCGTTTDAVFKAVTVSPETEEGTLSSASSVICKNTKPGDIVLSDNVGSILKWQSAEDEVFTTDVSDIVSTSSTLTGNDIGTLSATRYFRAVVQSGSCTVKYTEPVEIIVPAPLTYSGTWDGIPDATTPVIITEDLMLTTDLNVCNCQVTNGAKLTIPTGISLIIETDLTVDVLADIVVEDKGTILQADETAVNVGDITFKASTSTMKQYDYNYWSSPVSGWTFQELSPDTLSDKYFSYNPLINNWEMQNGTDIMEPGIGYIIRAPQGWSQSNATDGVYTGIFRGVPNSGTISATIEKGADVYNLIGNPYPSAIDLDLFLTDPDNANVISGTVYLWTHNTAISNLIEGDANYNYTRDDYAKYNITGGVRTATEALSGGTRPTGKLAAAEGFFIEANTDLPLGTYAAQFRNSMRIANTSSFESRTSAITTTPAPIEKNRIWISMGNSEGAYDETLLGYISGATNGIDRIYDGTIFPGGNVISIYSILGSSNLAIQGRALPFDQNEAIPLGYTTTLAGTFTIKLSDFDGLFEGQNVYLLDKNTETLQQLTASGYTFMTQTGTFDNRFELRFTNALLAVNQVDANNSMIAIKSGKEISVKTLSTAIRSVEIFDLTGRKLYAKNNINANEFSTSGMNTTQQMLLVKVTLENNIVATTKIMM